MAVFFLIFSSVLAFCFVFHVFLQLRCVHNLLFAMGNTLHADSQRQSGIALEVCKP